MPGHSITTLPPGAHPTAGVALPPRDTPIPARRPVRAPQAGARAGARRLRAGRLALLIGAVAVGGPLAVALSVTALVLAIVAAGPFFLAAILAAAFGLLVVGATGATA